MIQQSIYYGLPLVGVFLLGWDWRPIILLYWLENITSGAEALIGMIRTPNRTAPGAKRSRVEFTFGGKPVSNTASKPALISMFVVHYGFFTAVHGVFVFLLVQGFFAFVNPGSVRPSEAINFGALALVWLLGSAVYLFLTSRTPKETLPTLQSLFTSPYKRLFVLHITIIAGVGLIMWLNWPPAAAVLLVALHGIADLFDRKG